MISVPKTQFVEKLAGPVLIFRLLQAVDNRKNSALFGLTAIGRHHNVPLDIRRLLHDYAIGEGEVSVRQLIEIASDHSLKAKKVKLRWNDLEHMGQAFPLLGIKKDGSFHVICGMRRTEEGDEVVLVDPAWQAEHRASSSNLRSARRSRRFRPGRGCL